MCIWMFTTHYVTQACICNATGCLSVNYFMSRVYITKTKKRVQTTLKIGYVKYQVDCNEEGIWQQAAYYPNVNGNVVHMFSCPTFVLTACPATYIYLFSPLRTRTGYLKVKHFVRTMTDSQGSKLDVYTSRSGTKLNLMTIMRSQD